MDYFEIIAAEIDRNGRSNLLTASAIYSTVELIEGEIQSFYTNFPENSSEDTEGVIVVVTSVSIVETKINLPIGWASINETTSVQGITIVSRVVPFDSIIEVNVQSSPLNWHRDVSKRNLKNLKVVAKTILGDEITALTSSRYPTEPSSQDLGKTLKALNSKEFLK